MFLRTRSSIVVLAMAQAPAQARRLPSLIGEGASLAADAQNAGVPVRANLTCNVPPPTKRRLEHGFADMTGGGTIGVGRVAAAPTAPAQCNWQAGGKWTGGNAEGTRGGNIELAELQRAQHELRRVLASGSAQRGQGKMAQLHDGEAMTPTDALIASPRACS